MKDVIKIMIALNVLFLLMVVALCENVSELSQKEKALQAQIQELKESDVRLERLIDTNFHLVIEEAWK